MNKRLQLISEYITDGVGVVDVGTDHGYLPISLAQNGYKGNLFASDINEDPLNKARINAAEAGVDKNMEFLLCDGLKLCPPEKVDTIVIAGMGGDMIVKILDATEWCLDKRYKLILQPMSKAEIVRYWLIYNGFEIKEECLVDENGTIYQVIISVFGGYTKLNDAELYSGSFALNQDKELYRTQHELMCKRFNRAVTDMKAGQDIPQHRLKLFEEILRQLEEMKI